MVALVANGEGGPQCTLSVRELLSPTGDTPHQDRALSTECFCLPDALLNKLSVAFHFDDEVGEPL